MLKYLLTDLHDGWATFTAPAPKEGFYSEAQLKITHKKWVAADRPTELLVTVEGFK